MGSIDYKTGDWEAVFEMSKVKVMNTSGKPVQLGGGLSLKPGACVEAHPHSPLAKAVAAANEAAWAAVPEAEFADQVHDTAGIAAGEIHVTHSTKPAEGKTWVGVDLAKGPSKSAYGVKNDNPHPVVIDGHVFQPGEIVPASLIEKNAGAFKAALQHQPGLKSVVGYFTTPEVWAESMPTPLFDHAAAENELLAKYGDEDAHAAAMMEKQAAGMALVTIADVEKYLTLRGYAEFCVVEAEGTVMVEVRGMRDEFVEQLRADIRVRLPVTADVVVIAAPGGE